MVSKALDKSKNIEMGVFLLSKSAITLSRNSNQADSVEGTLRNPYCGKGFEILKKVTFIKS